MHNPVQALNRPINQLSLIGLTPLDSHVADEPVTPGDIVGVTAWVRRAVVGYLGSGLLLDIICMDYTAHCIEVI
jgi:hypothetical protein